MCFAHWVTREIVINMFHNLTQLSDTMKVGKENAFKNNSINK